MNRKRLTGIREFAVGDGPRWSEIARPRQQLLKSDSANPRRPSLKGALLVLWGEANNSRWSGRMEGGSKRLRILGTALLIV